MEIYLITILNKPPSLPPQKMKTVKIEVDKPIKKGFRQEDISSFLDTQKPFSRKRPKVNERKNTGIQVTISDDPYPIVTHLQALTREELPLEYLNSNLPKVWLFKDKLFSELDHVLLEIDKEKPYSRIEISAALLHIRLAGEHLAAVNKPKARYLRYRQAATFKDGRFT